MELRAFNLVQGCVLDDPDLPGWAVVVGVYRDPDSEIIRVSWMGHGEDVPESSCGVIYHEQYSYQDKIKVIGICVNSQDWEDTDFGTDQNKTDFTVV